MVWQAREHVSEPGLRIDGVKFGRSNQSVDSGGTTTAFIGAGEGPVLTSDGDSPQFTFGGVVGQANPSVIQEAREGVPAGEDVIDGLGRVVVLRQLGALLVEPSLKLSRERPTALLAHARALLRAEAIDLALNGEQEINALDRVGRDRGLASRAKSKNLRLACAQQAASVIGPPLRTGA